MRFKKLDLNLLVALDHLLTLKSVSGAADRMFMSQSAMSNALTRLRTYFDDPLLVQVGRRMELTPRAEAMQEAVRDILVRVEATIETAPEFDPTRSEREFGVLMSDYSMSVLMPHVLALAEAQNASARFRILAQTDKPFTLLERGDADLLVAPAHFCSPDHPGEVVYTDRYVAVTAAEGPWADNPLTLEAYQAAGHAVMIPPNNAHSVESELLEQLGIERRIEVRTFSFSALPALVAGTGRVATVHGEIARLAAQHLPIRVHPLPFEVPELRQTMQWHAYRTHDPGLAWLRELFLAAGQRMAEYQRHQ